MSDNLIPHLMAGVLPLVMELWDDERASEELEKDSRFGSSPEL